MKISELIYALECMKRDHGDLDVERMDMNGERIPIQPPELAHRAKLKGRERKPMFAESYRHEKDYEAVRKGDPVCRL